MTLVLKVAQYSTGFMLAQKIVFTKGVGEVKAKLLLQELGVATVGDYINLFPFRYDDRTQFHVIKDAGDSDHVQLIGTLVTLQKVRGKRGSRLVGLFKDSSGLIELTWFQGAQWLAEALQEGAEYRLFGRVKVFNGKKSIPHPEMELATEEVQDGIYLPVYSSTEKLNAKGLGLRSRRKIARHIFDHLKAEDVPENLPTHVLRECKMCSRYQAYLWKHFPMDTDEMRAATRRLKFEELYFMQLRILQGKMQRDAQLKGIVFDKIGDKFSKFYHQNLTFELTNAQKRVIKEMRADMGRGAQMNRLLQGDVGSGKTIVGLICMLIAIDNGYQACLLAPTEILAQQHYKSITDYVKGLGIQVAFLSGSVKGKKRQGLFHLLKEGHINILVGTHAILEDPVEFKALGLAVTDEQHRFGVVQRSKLWRKNPEMPPHILLMTATPIPRTLAMTTYGDLDVSIIDELPPGRKPITTVHKQEANRMQIVQFMKDEISAGRQIYIVYPLIEESAKLDLQNLQSGYEELLNYFPLQEYQIAVVHGRMKPANKEAEMQRFVKGTAHIMVATTVIEVGVDVPNASVMIIENAERFGLSQLHQLRGRVGRGADQSYCILMTASGLNDYARRRIKTMCATQDGFKIAEVDMELRGPGDIEGTLQSGVAELQIADLATDGKILIVARHYAIAALQKDPDHTDSDMEATWQHLSQLELKRQSWGRIS